MESVYNAIISTDSKYVIIHDGARPVIKSDYLDACIKYLIKYKGVLMGVKAKDTIKIVNSDMEVVNSTDRTYTWLAHTPQGFDRKILLKLHEKYKNLDNITDDSMLLEMDGYKVRMVEDDYSNIKITTYSDIDIVKSYLKK